MSDRFNSLTVVLDRDYKDEDAKYIIDAISMIRGVTAVSGDVADVPQYIGMSRARVDITTKLPQVLRE